jgi:protein-tyrosine sulfotransferase
MKIRRIRHLAIPKGILGLLVLIETVYILLGLTEYYTTASVDEKNTPIIFVGGVPRSGTTLMRALLDAHPGIRCGQETHVLPQLLGLKLRWFGSQNASRERLKNADVSEQSFDQAMRKFIYEIIVNHGKRDDVLCNKDPMLLRHSTYLSQLFPKSKFILMVRDARANVHSIVKRKVAIAGWDVKNYTVCLKKWNENMEIMVAQCFSLGGDVCHLVYYEQLVLHPEKILRNILKFLDVQWNDAVLSHEKYIGNEILLSKTELSTDQVIKPINLQALSDWVGKIPQQDLLKIDELAPMLKKLGYDTKSANPNYGEADAKIQANTRLIAENQDFWRKLAQNVSVHADRWEKLLGQ